MFIIYVIFGCFVSCVTSDTNVDEYYENIKNEPAVMNFVSMVIQKCDTHVDLFAKEFADVARDVAKECEKKFPTNTTYPTTYQEDVMLRGAIDYALGCANHCFVTNMAVKTGVNFDNFKKGKKFRQNARKFFDNTKMTPNELDKASEVWWEGLKKAWNADDSAKDCVFWGCHGYYVYYHLRSKQRCFAELLAKDWNAFS